jgi:ankyrin repeat protein
MIAASRGDLAEVRRLVEAGEDVSAADTFGNTALLYACRGGHADIVELLFRNGADVQVKNKQGMDCLDFAEVRGHEKVAGILRGAKLLLSIREGEVERVTRLLDSGVDVNHQLTDGWTPLMVAALEDQVEVANILLDRGADAALRNSKGLTAEMIAERKGHSRVIELLGAARRGGSAPVVARATEVEFDVLDLGNAAPVATSMDETDIVN